MRPPLPLENRSRTQFSLTCLSYYISLPPPAARSPSARPPIALLNAPSCVHLNKSWRVVTRVSDWLCRRLDGKGWPCNRCPFLSHSDSKEECDQQVTRRDRSHSGAQRRAAAIIRLRTHPLSSPAHHPQLALPYKLQQAELAALKGKERGPASTGDGGGSEKQARLWDCGSAEAGHKRPQPGRQGERAAVRPRTLHTALPTPAGRPGMRAGRPVREGFGSAAPGSPTAPSCPAAHRRRPLRQHPHPPLAPCPPARLASR